MEVRDFVADKLIRLKQALAVETECREMVEQQAGENAKRRTDLETALGEIQKVQEAFQVELETADNPKQLLELESSLGESQRARETLETKLEAARRTPRQGGRHPSALARWRCSRGRSTSTCRRSATSMTSMRSPSRSRRSHA